MVSTKGRYAIRFLLDLAEHADQHLIPLEDVAKRQEISKKYLEIVVRELVRGKLVKGISGKGGGYCLTRQPEEYTIWEILCLMEGSLASVACLSRDAEPCPRESCCKTLPMWKGFDELSRQYFSGITLADLAKGKVPVPQED